MTAPKLGPIVRSTGAAGGIAYTVTVTYPPAHGGTSHRVTFAGSVYGSPGPVLMLPADIFVDDPGRFGERLSPGWVRRFFER